ncbi:DUF2752 domain-containing protein [Kitasatospora cheerisanensis]|uniref:DUF2752 domain-containing protein n=1 Tax=Kitasatospora cheerisanensis TaxID=81942 RepID=UPI00055D2D11|nr:DUF2752 domain-containing protein [Kitasatospora cheerisanensis]
MNAPAAPEPVAGSVPRRLVRPLAALLAVAMPTAFVAAVDPNTPGHYPVCPVLEATGWFCPGCGGLRSVHALSRGDLLTAAHDNLMVTLLVLTALALWVRWTVRAVRGRPAGVRLTARQTVVLLLALALFSVLRNLPGGFGLAPPAV